MNESEEPITWEPFEEDLKDAKEKVKEKVEKGEWEPLVIDEIFCEGCEALRMFSVEESRVQNDEGPFEVECGVCGKVLEVRLEKEAVNV